MPPSRLRFRGKKAHNTAWASRGSTSQSPTPPLLIANRVLVEGSVERRRRLAGAWSAPAVIRTEACCETAAGAIQAAVVEKLPLPRPTMPTAETVRAELGCIDAEGLAEC